LLGLGISVAPANKFHCYNEAGLYGTYGVVATNSASVALALAVQEFDGTGNPAGTFTLNAPDTTSATGARKLYTGTQARVLDNGQLLATGLEYATSSDGAAQLSLRGRCDLTKSP